MERRVSSIVVILFCALLSGGVAEAGTVWIEAWDIGMPRNEFYFHHEEGKHERFVQGEDSKLLNPPSGPYISVSSKPYPYNDRLTIDGRNKESTLPIDIVVELTGQASADGDLYVQITDETGYEHRHLTIQEIPDPNNPDDPLNPNPEYDIRDRQDNHRGQVPGSGPLQQNVPRYWRVRCYTNSRGDMKEDGQIDFNDVNVIHSEWLHSTYDSNGQYVGNNYNVSDRNHDGLTNLLDFAILAENWWQLESGGPISKVIPSNVDGGYPAALQESAIKHLYGDKAKQVRIARLVRLPNHSIVNDKYGGLISQLARKEDVENPLEQKLNHNHEPKWAKHQYSTINHKLTPNYQRPTSRFSGKQYKRTA